jgi:branched-chain amino acid transport system substrate-binding protein
MFQNQVRASIYGAPAPVDRRPAIRLAFVGMMVRFICITAATLALLVSLVACGGGGSSSSSTPTGGGPTGNGTDGVADALLVIGSPQDANAVLADAVALGKVKTYLLTSLSMDPAAFDGVTFAGDDFVWGVQLLGPSEAVAAKFNVAYSELYGEAPLGAPVWQAYDAVYTVALAAVAANSGDGAAIRDNLTYVANSPGDIANYGSESFASAVDVLAAEGGDVNYIGASGQVDIDTGGEMSKGTAQTWKVLNGQIAPIETRDVDLAAESGDEVPIGELKRAETPPTEPLVIGVIVTDDEIGAAVNNAVQLAIDEINGAGGVFGLDVVLTVKTIADASGAGAAASALIDAGAGAIVGPVATDSVGPTLDAAKGASVPLLALSSAPELSALDGGGFLFRLTPSLALQMPVLANLALEGEATSVCVVFANGSAGETLAAAFKKAMDFKQATVRASEVFDPASGDYAALLESCIGS